ncbi:hypothetical protein [Chitinimonas sp. PSY-7]|uniref:hypothetical protein n=1 Tax=Chitinimonas sp. PSY-7 TaxID=3459088 RepID=UPI00403FE86D
METGADRKTKSNMARPIANDYLKPVILATCRHSRTGGNPNCAGVAIAQAALIRQKLGGLGYEF